MKDFGQTMYLKNLVQDTFAWLWQVVNRGHNHPLNLIWCQIYP